MEKKKMKLWEKILIILLTILVVYFITVFIKYIIFTKISIRYEVSRESSNFYYYSESEETIFNYWQKDNIKKLNVKQVNGEGNLTFWKDEKTGEELVFVEANKTYSETESAMFVSLAGSTIVPLREERLIRLVISLNPTVFIYGDKYNDVKCYTIKYLGDRIFTEKVDKETGLILYSEDSSMGPTLRKYTFNLVTDEDVKKPDVSKYKLENN